MEGHYMALVEGELNMFFRVSPNEFRILHLNVMKPSGFQIYNVKNSENRQVRISHNILKRHLEHVIEDEINDDQVDWN